MGPDLFSKFMAGSNNPFSLLKEEDRLNKDRSILDKAIQNCINDAFPLLFVSENRESSLKALEKLEKFSIDQNLDSKTIILIQSTEKRLSLTDNLDALRKKFLLDAHTYINLHPSTISDNADLMTLLSGSKKLVRLILDYSEKFDAKTPEIIAKYAPDVQTLHLYNVPCCTQWVEVFSKGLTKLKNLLIDNSPDFNAEGFKLLQKLKIKKLSCARIGDLEENAVANIATLRHLRELNIGQTHIRCHLPENFLPEKLEQLTLKDVQMKDDFISLGRLTHLKSLTLANCKLSKDTYNQLVNLASLESLNLSGSNFGSKEHLELLKHLPNLKYLNLSDCLLLEIHQDPLAYLHSLANLEGLALNGIRSFSDKDLLILAAQCPKLNTLWVKRRKPVDQSIKAALHKCKIGIDDD